MGSEQVSEADLLSLGRILRSFIMTGEFAWLEVNEKSNRLVLDGSLYGLSEEERAAVRKVQAARDAAENGGAS